MTRASVRDFDNVLHRILIEDSSVLKGKSIRKGLPTVRHPFKIRWLKGDFTEIGLSKRYSIENY